MAFILCFDEGGLKVREDEHGWDEVLGVNLLEIHKSGGEAPVNVSEISIRYEDDTWPVVLISEWEKVNRLGRPHSGLEFYVSSWHGPAPLPEEWEFQGKPGDFVVARYWNTSSCREDVYLDIWLEGNRPQEPEDPEEWFWGGIEED